MTIAGPMDYESGPELDPDASILEVPPFTLIVQYV